MNLINELKFGFFLIFVAHLRMKVQSHGCGNVTFNAAMAIGGEIASPAQFPYLIALIYKPVKQFFCGGTLITNQHALSG